MANTAMLSAFLEKKSAPPQDPLILPLHKLDHRFRSLPRGAMTEITGPRSSGRSALIHAILATATSLGETCAIIDGAGSFDPASATDNGVDLDRIFWVRCQGRPDHAMKAADLILHAGGFGVVVLDLCESAPATLRRIPLSWWYRFRNQLENTRTTFVVAADSHLTGSCAVCVLAMDGARPIWLGSDLNPLLAGIEITLVSQRPPIAGSAHYEAHLAG